MNYVILHNCCDRNAKLTHIFSLHALFLLLHHRLLLLLCLIASRALSIMLLYEVINCEFVGFFFRFKLHLFRSHSTENARNRRYKFRDENTRFRRSLLLKTSFFCWLVIRTVREQKRCGKKGLYVSHYKSNSHKLNGLHKLLKFHEIGHKNLTSIFFEIFLYSVHMMLTCGRFDKFNQFEKFQHTTWFNFKTRGLDSSICVQTCSRLHKSLIKPSAELIEAFFSNPTWQRKLFGAKKKITRIF